MCVPLSLSLALSVHIYAHLYYIRSGKYMPQRKLVFRDSYLVPAVYFLGGDRSYLPRFAHRNAPPQISPSISDRQGYTIGRIPYRRVGRGQQICTLETCGATHSLPKDDKNEGDMLLTY